MRKKSFGFIILVIIIGAVIGSVLGEVLGYIMPVGVVKQFFLKSAVMSFGPGTIDILIMTLTLGFSVKINIMSIIGILIAAYVLRWIE